MDNFGYDAHLEERRAERLCESCSLLVKRLSDGMEGLAKTEDLSLCGLGFKSSQPISAGTEVELLLALERRVLKARGQVARLCVRDDGGYSVGVRFTRLEARAEHMLRSLLELEGIMTVNPERGCRAAA